MTFVGTFVTIRRCARDEIPGQSCGVASCHIE